MLLQYRTRSRERERQVRKQEGGRAERARARERQRARERERARARASKSMITYAGGYAVRRTSKETLLHTKIQFNYMTNKNMFNTARQT